MAGKLIALFSFYAWEFFSFRWGGGGFFIRDFSASGRGFGEFPELAYAAKGLIVFWGCIFISLADLFSVWGAWTLKSKYGKSGGSVRNESADLKEGGGA